MATKLAITKQNTQKNTKTRHNTSKLALVKNEKT